MDYFNDLLATFLDVDRVKLHCCLWRVGELLECFINILICVPKINEGLTDLEQHEGE